MRNATPGLGTVRHMAAAMLAACAAVASTAADASQRESSGACQAPYMTDPQAAAGKAPCCLDVDRDRRCDERHKAQGAKPAVSSGKGSAGPRGRVPQPMIGADGSLTRSMLDPEAVVAVGQPAPDFSTSDSTGRFFRLIFLREKTNAVLVFCPGTDAAPACAARLASLRASRAELARREAQVFVISEWKGAAPTSARQATRPGLSWLSDPGLKIASCYARRTAGEKATPRPMVVIVDKRGKVVRAIDDPRGTQPPTADLLRSIGPAPAPASSPPEKTRDRQ